MCAPVIWLYAQNTRWSSGRWRTNLRDFMTGLDEAHADAAIDDCLPLAALFAGCVS
jgi:hypothetical protein